MEQTVTQLRESLHYVRQHWTAIPTVGVILGSGLGGWAASLTNAQQLAYQTIPHMPTASVIGHAGNLWFGQHGHTQVACLQGRVHLYEGHSVDRVVFGARLLALMGCKTVILTNAAGGINASFHPGDLMLIHDHINLSGNNPLVGRNIEALGKRFPDMSTAYDETLRSLAKRTAEQQHISLHEGVYASLMGPSYETPAEIRMLRTIGADAVGMSTVLEVIALRHMGVRVGALSCITNLAAGIAKTELDHAEVEAIATQTQKKFSALLSGWIESIQPMDHAL